jgi:predicted DNA-binding transcriptional regulator YafY
VSEQFMRQLAMLRAVSRYPAKSTTGQISERLAQQGYSVDLRTIQRDLKRFSGWFPDLQSDGKKGPQGWYWRREARIEDLPGLDVPMAVTFMLAERFLDRLLPPAVLRQLNPYFRSARRVLGEEDRRYRTDVTGWADKVRVISRSQPLIPADIESTVIQVVYQALLEGKQFRGRYRRRDGDEAEYVFHPLGLVVRESVIYLVAAVWDYRDPRHYALHRFRECRMSRDNTDPPEDFKLDEYLSSGTFQYAEPEGAEIQLIALFTEDVALHLRETPLSTDQRMNAERDGWVRITATVKDSQQLRWWLLGFGGQVEVVGPGGVEGGVSGDE